MLLLNPAFAYAAVWSMVLGLYALRFSDLLEPLKAPTAVLVGGTSLAFVLGWVIESLTCHGKLAVPRFDRAMIAASINAPRTTHRLRWTWIWFCCGVLFEIVYFRGAPGLGLLGIGASMSYTEFGIHGFHGLMNALFFASCAVTFTRILMGNSTSVIPLIVASLGYPVLTMSREVLISALLQYWFLYLSLRTPSLKLALRTGIPLLATFFIFGYLGDLRSGRDNIIALGAPSFEYPDWLPSAFLWFYIYLCTPLNNVNHNIGITPNYLPLETAGTFIPSFAREPVLSWFGIQNRWELVTDTFNVSSLLESLLSDFGITGAIAFTLMCGIIFARVLRNSARSSAAYLVLIVILHGIALSFFANLLFNLISMFEVLVVTWLVAPSKRR